MKGRLMFSRLRSRLTYANVVASLALFLAIGGGTAFAVTAIDNNSVFSRHIVDGEVKGADLGVNSIGSGKVIDDSLRGRDVTGLTGGDVTDDSLGGADVAESSLGQVPSAASAHSANSATTAGNTNGLELRAFHYAENANSSIESIFSLGGVSVGASCSSTGNLSL